MGSGEVECLGCLGCGQGCGGRCSHQRRCPRRSQPNGAARHPFAAGRRHDGVRGACWSVGSIRGSDHATDGGHDLHDPHRASCSG